MAIPFATTTIAVLRAAQQPDGYPDVEPVYTLVVSGVRANLEIMPRRITSETKDRSVAIARFIADRCDVQPLDYIRDLLTSKLWLVEWVEDRPGFTDLAHVTGQLLDVATEVAAAVPLIA